MSTVGGGVNIVTNGIVLYLDPANTKSFVSGSTSLFDLTSNKYNAQLTNGPTFNSENGGSIVFDGTNDFVKGNNTFSELDGTNKATLSMWVKPTNLTTSRILFHIPRNTTQSNSQVLIYLRTTGQLDISVSTLPSFCRSNTGVITAGVWNHILICFDLAQGTQANKVRPFVNGVDVFNASNVSLTTFPTSSGEIWVGEEANGYLAPFLGNISNLILYNRVLTTSEILQNFNATRARFGL
jgi:hypothetical protein